MNRITTGVFLAALVTATAAGAQIRAADGDVNATSDEAHDTLSPQAQAAAPPSRSDSFWYARLGYGGVFGDNFMAARLSDLGSAPASTRSASTCRFSIFRCPRRDQAATPMGRPKEARRGPC